MGVRSKLLHIIHSTPGLAQSAHAADVIVSQLLAHGVTVQGTGALIVQRTTTDFTDLEIAKERGWYRKHYFCPACNLEIAIESYEGDYMFGSGSVLKDNSIPRHCPDCGTPVRKEVSNGKENNG